MVMGKWYSGKGDKMDTHIMTFGIFVCLLLLALIALAKPFRMVCQFILSAAMGSFVLFLGQSLGAEVGINAITVVVSGILGLPGASGMLLLSVLL